MAKPFAALISQVFNNATNNGRLATDLNRELIADEFLQLAAKQLRQTLLGGKNISMTPFCTSLPRLQIEQADFTKAGLLDAQLYEPARQEARAFGLPVAQMRQFVRLPELVNWGGYVGEDRPAIEYLGPLRGTQRLLVYTGNDHLHHAHRKAAGQQPFAWVNENVAWLFSPRPIAWTELSARCVLADPRHAAEFGRHFDELETPYPAPDDFVDDIAMQLINRYISMYGRYNGAPRANDGNHVATN